MSLLQFETIFIVVKGMVVHQVHNNMFKWIYFLNGLKVVHFAWSESLSWDAKIIGPTQAKPNKLIIVSGEKNYIKEFSLSLKRLSLNIAIIISSLLESDNRRTVWCHILN